MLPSKEFHGCHQMFLPLGRSGYTQCRRPCTLVGREEAKGQRRSLIYSCLALKYEFNFITTLCKIV